MEGEVSQYGWLDGVSQVRRMVESKYIHTASKVFVRDIRPSKLCNSVGKAGNGDAEFSSYGCQVQLRIEMYLSEYHHILVSNNNHM